MAKLKRALGLFETTMYGIGIILGAGIYVLIGKAAGVSGNAVWLAFLAAAVVAALTGLSYAELSSMFPKAAAEYVYTRKAFNNKTFSFMIGWLMLFVLTVASAAVSLGFGGYFSVLFGTPLVPAALFLVIALSALNFWGIKESAWMNILFTLIELTGLLIIIFFGMQHLGSVNYFEMPEGFGGIMSATILVFFAYLGFEDLVNISEEVKNPKRTVPKAVIYSIAITTVIYILVALSSVSIIPWQQLGISKAPLADVANAAWPGSAAMLSVIALFATANTVLFLMVACSRVLYGMAKQGAMPKKLCVVHSSRCTPWIAIFVVMFAVLGFVTIGNIKTVAEMTNWGSFFVFCSVNLSLICLRKTKPKVRRPFKVPLHIGWVPLLPTAGALFCIFMLAQFDVGMTLMGICILASGIVAHKTIEHFKKA